MSQPPAASISDIGSSAKDMDLEPLAAWVDLAPDCVGPDRVEGVLLGLAQVAAQVVAGAEAASLTLVGPDGTLSTPESTAALAQQMDTWQYNAAQGPCVQAAGATEWTKILVADLADQTQWPALTSHHHDGPPARSVLSVSLFQGPRHGAGGTRQAVGALNLYATAPGVFSEPQRDTALLLALYAALALAATEALSDASTRVQHLKAAMATQTVIGQAQGILMERHKLTAGQAFDRLRTASMNLNRKLRDVAKDLSDTGDEQALTPHRAITGTESARIKELARYDILDTPPDDAFERVAALAANLFDVPIATVALVDTNRVWYKASQGLGTIRQTTRDPGLCASVITSGKPYVVTNTRTDPRTTTHPLVTGNPKVQFYAAAPITTPNGYHLGTLAVMDTQPHHQPTPQQLATLTDLAAVIMDNLELRLTAINALHDSRPNRY